MMDLLRELFLPTTTVSHAIRLFGFVAAIFATFCILQALGLK